MPFITQTFLQLEQHCKPWRLLTACGDSALEWTENVSWDSGQADLSDRLSPGNGLDVTWCFPLCTCLWLIPVSVS